jgi:iron complex transport system ATP-binding protein
MMAEQDQGGLAAVELDVGWGKKTIVRVPTLQLNKGECLVLAGPNGAGKSTIVKTLARQIAPIAGTLKLNGREFSAWNSSEFATRVAYVPQSVQIYRTINVEEWVSLGRNPHQPWWSWRSTDSDREVVNNALEETGLSDLRSKHMDELSGGERQRAAIAMALAQSPQYLLLDEPSAHLDFRHQIELVELISKLRQRGLGILLVLHDLNMISRVASRIIFLKATPGEVSTVAREGTPSDVLIKDVLREIYEVDVSILQDSTTGTDVFLPTRVWP